ncbi:MAG: hypothetical protein PHO32_06500 [Candidatus Cloacimonetes bacterium]|nr:hypothetical protein [Candidatus Cloacimonadota bacterium]
MKKLSLLLLLLVLLSFGCSEKDDNPTDLNVYGYKLHQFITKSAVNALVDPAAPDTVDYRGLFAYEIVASDGYSPRSSSNAGYDLPWQTFKDGYVVPTDEGKTWFPNANLPGAFKVKYANLFRLYRKVDVLTCIGSKMVELHSLPIYQIDNWSSPPAQEPAIKLSDLIQGIADADTLILIAGDGYSRSYTAEKFNDGYYLLNSEVTTFPNFNATMTGGEKKFKRLASIDTLCQTEQSYTFTNADTTSLNISFPLPADLSTYEREVLTDY